MASEGARRKESNLYPRCPALEEVMKRFRAASSLVLALSLVLAGLIGFGAPSAQAVHCNDGTTQASCENNGGPAPTVTAPIAPIVPAPAPIAPIVPSVPPPAGCGPNTSWNGTFCAPGFPTL